jgi:hypothetical protein
LLIDARLILLEERVIVQVIGMSFLQVGKKVFMPEVLDIPLRAKQIRNSSL